MSRNLLFVDSCILRWKLLPTTGKYLMGTVVAEELRKMGFKVTSNLTTSNEARSTEASRAFDKLRPSIKEEVEEEDIIADLKAWVEVPPNKLLVTKDFKQGEFLGKIETLEPIEQDVGAKLSPVAVILPDTKDPVRYGSWGKCFGFRTFEQLEQTLADVDYDLEKWLQQMSVLGGPGPQ